MQTSQSAHKCKVLEHIEWAPESTGDGIKIWAMCYRQPVKPLSPVQQTERIDVLHSIIGTS